MGAVFLVLRQTVPILPKKLPCGKRSVIIKQNIVFALGVKGLFLILGALGVSNMWAAVFADVGVAMIAILNAMRMLRGK